ncbi:hypothetical protein GCM10028805_02680 [Spirosoma harenae]
MNYFRNILIWIAMTACSQAQTTDEPKVPTGYLYKVDAGLPGKTVYICGQRPFTDTGKLVGSGDLAAQTRQIFDNIKTSLATVDMSLSDVDQITYSVKEDAGITQVNSVKTQMLKNVEATYFPQTPKIVEVKAVPQTFREDVLLEIEVIAIK